MQIDSLKSVIDKVIREVKVVSNDTPLKKFRLVAIKQFARLLVDVEDQVGFVKRQLVDIIENHSDKRVQLTAQEALSSLESFKRARKNLSMQLMTLLMKVGKR